MNGYPFESSLELAKIRQEELRAVARQQPGFSMTTLRQRLGTAIIRAGRWLEGCRPATHPVSTTAR